MRLVRASRSDAVSEDIWTRAQELAGPSVRKVFESLEATGDSRFELAKSLLGTRELAMGLAEAVAERCVVVDSTEFRVCVPRQIASVPLVLRALREHGLEVRGFRRHLIASLAAWGPATVAAVGGVLVHAARYGSRQLAPSFGEVDVWLAAHGEWSNRSKHVLSLSQSEARRWPVLVLGRPRESVDQVRERWAKELGHDRVDPVRPFDLRSAAKSLPRAFLGVGRAAWSAYRAEIPLQPRDVVAIAYRTMLGETSARWLKGFSSRPRWVVFGHTGLADTNALERAVHRGGGRTMHVVHGVSAGVNFTGLSSVGLFRSRHDARWHEALGGYGRCVSIPAEVAARGTPDGQGLLLLTNLAHPMNPSYQLFGVRDELDILRAVSAAHEMVARGGTRTWRPHPLSASLGSHWDDLRAQAETLGYQLAAGPFVLDDAARRSRWCLSTPSTVLMDLAALGWRGGLVLRQPVDPASIYGAIVDKTQCDISGIAAMLLRMDGEGRQSASGAPSRNASWVDILRVMSNYVEMGSGFP